MGGIPTIVFIPALIWIRPHVSFPIACTAEEASHKENTHTVLLGSTETAYSRKSIMRDDIQVINDALPPPFNSHQPQYVLLALNSGAAFVDAGAGATRGVNILEHETNRPTSGVAVTASMLARVFPEGFYHLLLRFMDFLEG